MITSLDNKKVKEFTKLHNKKYREDTFLILNEEMIKEAHKNNLLDILIYTNKLPFEFDNSIEVSKEVLNKIAKEENLNYIGVGKKIVQKDNYKNRVMILEDLADPMNIGRIIDAAYLFGFDSIIISGSSADIYNQKCLEEAKTSLYKINIKFSDIEQEIKELKKQGFKIYATGLKKHSKELYEVEENKKMAFILGNEGSGVKEETMNISDDVIKIDMLNIDSLNVAMAGAILMYRFQKK